MQKSDGQKSVKLTLVKGGKVTPDEFSRLSLPEKIAALRALPPKRKLDLILEDTSSRELARSFQPQELYWLVKDIGEADCLELWQLASPEQRTFILDMELWEKTDYSEQKAFEWLGYLLEAGEDTVIEQLPQMDLELLILMLQREISVGGGIGDLLSDDERTGSWDHTFDNVYFITFRNSEHARLIGTFLDIVFRSDRELYLGLMEGVKGELESEMEELAYHFRSGRLADIGFPELEDALTLYARLDPATFTVTGGKKPSRGIERPSLPAPLTEGHSLLQRALARAESEEVDIELNYLINSALMVDGKALTDRDAMHSVFERVHGYLNIALEYLAEGNEEEATAILMDEYLKRLFQLGFSLVLGLHKRAERLTSSDYATNKALLGLKGSPPRYYRALDPEGIDGYREFRELEDIRKAEDFLKGQEGD